MISTMMTALALMAVTPTTAPAADYSGVMSGAEDEAEPRAEAIAEEGSAAHRAQAVSRNVERVRAEIAAMQRPRVVEAERPLRVVVEDRRSLAPIATPAPVPAGVVATPRPVLSPSVKAENVSPIVQYGGLAALVAIAIAMSAIAIATWRRAQKA